MQILTPENCTKWLASNGLLESPYGEAVPQATQYVQLNISQCPVAANIAIDVLARIVKDGFNALIQITDWSSFEIQELYPALSDLRNAKDWSTFWRGGVAFQPGEEGCLKELTQYVFEEGMSAYLYVVKPQITFYFWEGELLDIWSQQEPVLEKIFAELCGAGANITSRI